MRVESSRGQMHATLLLQRTNVVSYLIGLKFGPIRVNRVKVVHFQFGRVPVPVLRVFRWHMKINVTEQPPLCKASRKVNLPPPTPHTWDGAPIDVCAIVQLLERLFDLEAVPFNCKGIVLLQMFKGARRINVLHPMHIDAIVLKRIAYNGHIAEQINGRTVMFPTRVVAFGRTPLTVIGGEFPSFTGIERVGPTKARIRVKTPHVEPLIWRVNVIRPIRCLILISELIQITPRTPIVVIVVGPCVRVV